MLICFRKRPLLQTARTIADPWPSVRGRQEICISRVLTDLSSAQLILEQSNHGSLTDSEQNPAFSVVTGLLSATVVSMAEDLNAELAKTPFELLRPLALYSIFQVCQIYVGQSQRDTHPKYKHGVRVLLQALSNFERRWRLAGKTPSSPQLEESISTDLMDRRFQSCNHFTIRGV